MATNWQDMWHLVVAVLVGYALGFEREIRGAAAGVRVFTLIGIGSGVVGMLAHDGSPNALAGILTGIGFIGGGLVFGQDVGKEHLVHGITTAAAIFGMAGLGAAAGLGHVMLAVTGGALAILVLETRHIRGLRLLDARHWAHRFRDDDQPKVVSAAPMAESMPAQR